MSYHVARRRHAQPRGTVGSGVHGGLGDVVRLQASDRMMRTYKAENDVASATWGRSQYGEQTVANVHKNVAFQWAGTWSAAAAAVVGGMVMGVRVLGSPACHSQDWGVGGGCDKLRLELDRFNYYYQYSLPAAPTDADGVLRGAAAAEYWNNLFAMASFIDAVPDAVTDAAIAKSAAVETMRDIGEAFKDAARAAGGTVFDLLLEFLKPLAVPLAIGVAGYFLLPVLLKEKR